jgi:dTDP-glucose 4,6-dehydratase
MILVTGGAGFIGGNYAIRHFKNNSEALLIVDKFTYAANLETIKIVISDSRNLLIRGDIGDSELITEILKQYKPFAIVNFAAESHVDRSIHGPKDFIQTNIVGTFNLLESVRNYYDGLTGIARDCFRFLHVSTDEVYGSLEESSPAFLETNSYEPNSPYAASKAASDHLVRAWFHTYGLPVLTTNCSNNYGPYQFLEKLIPLVIHNALNGKPLPMYGDGLQVRDWLYVEDHCEAIDRKSVV